MGILTKLLIGILLLPFILTALVLLLPFIFFLLVMSFFVPSIHSYTRFQTFRAKRSDPETNEDVCDVECIVLDSEKVDDPKNTDIKYLKKDL